MKYGKTFHEFFTYSSCVQTLADIQTLSCDMKCDSKGRDWLLLVTQEINHSPLYWHFHVHFSLLGSTFYLESGKLWTQWLPPLPSFLTIYTFHLGFSIINIFYKPLFEIFLGIPRCHKNEHWQSLKAVQFYFSCCR